MKTEDRMMQAIRQRKDLPPTHISLRKLLACGDMEHYLNLCSDRLAKEEMIDGENIEINFADFPDLLFNSDGLFECRHILENYLSADMLIDAWELLRDAERRNNEINSLAAAFREMKLRELWKCYKETKPDDAGQLARKWIAAELWGRFFISCIQRKAEEALMHVYVNVKYKRLFDMIRTATGS